MRMRHCQLFCGLLLIAAASFVQAAPPAAPADGTAAKTAPAGAGAANKAKKGKKAKGQTPRVVVRTRRTPRRQTG